MRLLEKLTDPHNRCDRLTPLSGDYGLEIGPVADVPAEWDDESSWRVPDRDVTALKQFSCEV
jgi:hypothetical protein